jgi:hypothetical protein
VAAEHRLPLRTNSAAVAHWVQGTHSPRPESALILAEVLTRRMRTVVTPADLGLASQHESVNVSEAMSDPVASLAELGRCDVDRRKFLRTAVFSLGAVGVPAVEVARRVAAADRGGSVGKADVDVVRGIVDAFAAADERVGGGRGRTAVAEFLATDLAGYLNSGFADSEVRRAMFGAAAELAHLAGWKAHDAGLEGLAQRYYLHSWQLAQESDPRAQAAWVLRIMAHQAIDAGHGRDCVDLAEAALAGGQGRVDPATEMLLWLTVARTRADCGDRTEALAAVARAERLPVNGRDGAPRWAARAGDHQALLASHTAKTLRSLGDGAALEHMWRSVDRWDAHTYPRVRGLNMISAGSLHCAQGNLDDACSAWSEALGLLQGVDSARVRDAVSGVRASLAPYRLRGVGAARQVDALAASFGVTPAV